MAARHHPQPLRQPGRIGCRCVVEVSWPEMSFLWVVYVEIVEVEFGTVGET